MVFRYTNQTYDFVKAAIHHQMSAAEASKISRTARDNNNFKKYKAWQNIAWYNYDQARHFADLARKAQLNDEFGSMAFGSHVD